MVIKEIYVAISLPYEKKPYQFGKIEFSELIAIEDGEDVEEIRMDRFDHLLSLAKEEANAIRQQAMEELDEAITHSAKKTSSPAQKSRPVFPPTAALTPAQNSGFPPRRRRPQPQSTTPATNFLDSREPEEDDIPF